MNSAQWRPVPGFDGYYASDTGQIASAWQPTRVGSRKVKPWHLLKQRQNRHGYMTVKIVTPSKASTVVTVARFVALAWLGPKPEGTEICHSNGQQRDNRPGNLRYDTKIANNQDKVKHGTSTRGEANNTTKLTEQDVRAIRQRLARGDKQRTIAADYGVRATTICEIAHNRSWRWLS